MTKENFISNLLIWYLILLILFVIGWLKIEEIFFFRFNLFFFFVLILFLFNSLCTLNLGGWLTKDDLNVCWWWGVWLYTAMCLVDTAPAVLGGSVALDVGNFEIFNIDFNTVLLLCLGLGKGVLDQLDVKLGTLNGPSGTWAAPFVALCMVGNTLVVAEKWNGTLLSDNSFKILKSFCDFHTFKNTACLKHWLEVDALLTGPCFKALVWFLATECVMFSHSSKGRPKPLRGVNLSIYFFFNIFFFFLFDFFFCCCCCWCSIPFSLSFKFMIC